MGMAVRVSRLLLQRLREQVRASRAEICGLLTGADDHIADHVAAVNVAHDPSSRFEIDPAVLFATLKAERRGGPAIVGCYHSHPSGDPCPSRIDAADAAADGRLWLILTHEAAGLWRAVDDGARFGRFDAVAWSVVTPCGLHDGAGFSKRPGEPHIRSLDA